MDDPLLDAAEHRVALRELARLNRVTMIDSHVWGVIGPLARRLSRPLRVLDVATGSADVPIRLAARARKEGLELELHGWDISEVALAAARTRAENAGVRISLRRIDVLSEALPEDGEGFDVAHCGLFLHHLDPPQVETVLRSMARVANTVIVQDLRRTRFGLALAWAAPRLLSGSRVVRVDAVRSVHGAYTMEEMREMAARAGLGGGDGARVRAVQPQRQLLVWHRGRDGVTP